MRLFRPGFALVLVFLPALLSAEITTIVPTAEGSGVKITLATPVAALPRQGFVPVRVLVENYSGKEGVWSVDFTTGALLSPGGTLGTRLDLAVPASQNKEAWVYVPLPTAGAPYNAPPEIRRGASGQAITWKPYDPSARVVIDGAVYSIQTGTNSQGMPVTRMVPQPLEAPEPEPAAPPPPRESWLKRLVNFTRESPASAERSARQALASTNLLDLPENAFEDVSVVPLSTGGASPVQLWMTRFEQTGPRAALTGSGEDLAGAGIIVQYHPSPERGKIMRTVTHVDPVKWRKHFGRGLAQPEEKRVAAARAMLMRHGFLHPRDGVRATRGLPGRTGNQKLFEAGGAVMWFEIGAPRLLPSPLPGSLPDNILVFGTAGSVGTDMIRTMVVLPNSADAAALLVEARRVHQLATGIPDAVPELAMEVRGPGLVSPAKVAFAGLVAGGAPQLPPFAVSPALEQPLRLLFQRIGAGELHNLAVLEPAALPVDWRIWAPFHAVVLRAADYENLDPTQRAALRGWVAQGGRLLLEPAGPVETTTEEIGLGSIATLPEPLEKLAAAAAQTSPTGPVARVFINSAQFTASGGRSGVTIATPPAALHAPEAVNTDRLVVLFGLRESSRLFPAAADLHPSVLPYDLPPPENPGANRTPLALAALALLAGPVNLIYLAPKGRRRRLFLTTPALVALFLVAHHGGVFRERFVGDGARAAVVVLLPEELHAVVYQDQVARTGAIRSGTFPMEASTVMTNIPVGEFDGESTRESLFRSADSAAGDWFRKDWGEAQHLRRLTPTRSRIELVNPGGDGAPVVISTIPSTIETLVYVDSANRLWMGSDLVPGRSTELEEVEDGPWPPFAPQGSAYLGKVFSTAARREPGRWIARAGPTYLAPIRTLESLAWRDDIVYTGILK